MNVSQFESYVTRVMEAYDFPGLSVAVVKDDTPVLTRGFGMKTAGGEPVSEHTGFGIGSLTKAFTSTLLAHVLSTSKGYFSSVKGLGGNCHLDSVNEAGLTKGIRRPSHVMHGLTKMFETSNQRCRSFSCFERPGARQFSLNPMGN